MEREISLFIQLVDRAGEGKVLGTLISQAPIFTAG